MKVSYTIPLILFLFASCGGGSTDIIAFSSNAYAQDADVTSTKVHLVMDASETVTSFGYTGHRVQVAASVNGGKDATFLVMLSSLVTFIDEDAVQEAGLEVKKAGESDTGEVVNLAVLDSIRVGGAKLEGLPVWPRAMNLSTIKGVLGLDFLGAMETMLDYKKRRLTLRFPQESRIAGTDETHVFPLTMHEAQGPTVHIGVGGDKSLDCMLNTSNPHFIHLNKKDAERLGIVTDSPLYDVAESPDGPVRQPVVRIADLHIGRMVLTNVYAHITDKPSELGNLVLEHCIVTVNLQRKLAALQPVGSGSVALEPEFGTGATLTITEGSKVVVIDVIPESPAKKAGLQVKDQIVEVAGKALGKNPLDILREIPKAPGSMNDFKVRRGNEVLEFHIPRNLMM